MFFFRDVIAEFRNLNKAHKALEEKRAELEERVKALQATVTDKELEIKSQATFASNIFMPRLSLTRYNGVLQSGMISDLQTDLSRARDREDKLAAERNTAITRAGTFWV